MKYATLLFLLLSQWVSGQSFTTRVSPKVIGREDVLLVEYIADNADIDQFSLPQFINWTLVSGPDMSNSKVVINNQVQEQTVYSVMLKPHISGTIVIPGASALINSKPQKSDAVTVQVKNVPHTGTRPHRASPQSLSLFDLPPVPAQVPANQYLRKGENVQDKIKNNILVKLDVDKTSCYMGEPLIASYKLCSRLQSQSKVVKQPSFSGCTVEELTGSAPDQHIEKINGQEFNVFVIRKVQLTPLHEGTLTLPETMVENTISFYTSDGGTDVFGNPAGPTQQHQVTLESKPVAVTVKPLPAFAGPGSFSGAIGNFSLAIRQAETALTTNGVNHLIFSVQGTGNLQTLKMPAIAWPKGIEPFEATEKEALDQLGDAVVAEKNFTLPFSADEPGNYLLPAIPVTFFDPTTGKYTTRETKPFMFSVVPGSKAGSDNSSAESAAAFDQRLYILLGSALLLIIIGVAWYSGTRRSKLSPDIVVEQPTAPPVVEEPSFSGREYVFSLQLLQPTANTAGFYKGLNKILTDYVAAKYEVAASTVPAFAAQRPELSDLKTLLDHCTLGMYTPVYSMEEAMHHRLQALSLLEQLERA